MRRLCLLTLIMILVVVSFFEQVGSTENLKVREVLCRTTIVAYPEEGRLVNRTVAEALQLARAPQAKIVSSLHISTRKGREGYFELPLLMMILQTHLSTMGYVP